MPIVELMPHNIETFAAVKATLVAKHQVAIVQATGTGKSFLVLRLLEELFRDKRILYVVPWLRIGENFKQYKEFQQLGLDFTVVTYNSFGSAVPPSSEDYDVIIIDEFHHIGSAIYGKALLAVREEMLVQGKWVIAVSATPVRALDNYRDMGEEVFADCVVSGIAAETAIKNGLIPKPIYALAIHDGVANDWCSDGRINVPSCVDSVRSMVQEYCAAETPRKWLVYATTVEDFGECSQCVRDIFLDIQIFCVSHHNSTQKNEEIIGDFIACDKQAALLSVSMLLEGTHLPTPIAGIINFRHIVSANVFWQMLGRLYDVWGRQPSLFINIAGTRFYKPTVYSCMSGLGYKPGIVEQQQHVFHDVTSVAVLEYLDALDDLKIVTGFVVDGIYYSNLLDFYERNKAIAAVGYSSFVLRVRAGQGVMTAITEERKHKIIAITYHKVTYANFVRLGAAYDVDSSLLTNWWHVCGEDEVKFSQKLDAYLGARANGNRVFSVTYDGQVYHQFKDLSAATGIGTSTLHNWFVRGGRKDEYLERRVHEFLKKAPRIIIYHGVRYPSIVALAASLGVTPSYVNALYNQASKGVISFDDEVDTYLKRRVARVPPPTVFKFLDVIYDGWEDLAEACGLAPFTVRKIWREVGGDQVLFEAQVQRHREQAKKCTFAGVMYSSISEMCKALNCSHSAISRAVQASDGDQELFEKLIRESLARRRTKKDAK